MKIAYIAHPISGDVKGNLISIERIAREINLKEPDVVPFAPYYLDCIVLDDDNPGERSRGIRNDQVLLRAGFVTEMRLYGHKISTGMIHEVVTAIDLGIPVYAMTQQTKGEFHILFPNYKPAQN